MTPSKAETDSYEKLLTMDGRILPTVAIQVLKSKQERDKERDNTKFHPSELAKKDWCPRASWYSFTSADKKDESFSFQRLNVFAEGHAIHAKWQKWLRDAGVLEGMWRCMVCGHKWWDVSPHRCTECASNLVSYAEVPLASEEYMLVGHADGIVSDRKGRTLIEIKSLGLGTIRWEAPDLYGEYISNNLSMDALWKKIRQPFASHVRQGMLYMHFTGIHDLVFIYEWKPTQDVKEFSIKYLPELVEPILDSCKRVIKALDGKIPPMRPAWAESVSCSGCKFCPFKNTCWRE